MTKKNDVLVENIIESLGGKDNISFITHCTTRLRTTLKDKGLIDDDTIKGIQGVIDCRWTGDQLQIIIGPQVADVYDVICDKTGLQKQDAINETLDVNLVEVKKNKFNYYSIVEIISHALQPSLFVFVGVGMIKVLLIFLELFGILSTDSSTYLLLFGAADAVFYFLPVFVGYGVAKKMGCEPILGVVMGAFLVAPSFIANVNSGVAMDFLGIGVYPKAYNSTFLPAVLCTVVMCPIYSFFEKKIPKIIRNLVAPLCTFLIVIPLAYILLAPIASIVGDYLAVGIMWIYNMTGFMGVAMFCAVLPFLITTGMHFCFYPYWGTVLAAGGAEYFYLISNCIFNINAGIACIVIGLKTKIIENKSLSTSVGISSLVGGISEPALFGILLKNKKALLAVIIGDFIGGAAAGLLSVAAHMWPPSWGIFMIPSFIDSGMGLVYCVIAIVAGALITAIGTFILYQDEQSISS